MPFIFNCQEAERLRYMYVEEGRSTNEIARIMHCHPTTVLLYLRRAGVERRSPTSPRGTSLDHREMELIRFWYHQEKLSIRLIAKRLGLSDTAVQRRMASMGIERRDYAESERIRRQRERQAQRGQVAA